MVPSEENSAPDVERLRDRLEAFVQNRGAEGAALPWVARLSPPDRERLRRDLALILSEPELTGEPIDWQEIDEILREWAEAAGWDGALVPVSGSRQAGPYSVELPSRDAEALVRASAAVQSAVEALLAAFLPFHPTAGRLLPRGRLKKLKDRDVWQIVLPDGYRLRYLLDQRERRVQVLYLGPHPDRGTAGRERAARLRMQRGQNGSE